MSFLLGLAVLDYLPNLKGDLELPSGTHLTTFWCIIFSYIFFRCINYKFPIGQVSISDLSYFLKYPTTCFLLIYIMKL